MRPSVLKNTGAGERLLYAERSDALSHGIGKSMIHSPLEIKPRLYGFSPPRRVLQRSKTEPKHHIEGDEIEIMNLVKHCFYY